MKNVSKNIKRFRRRRGWTQDEMAKKLNISIPTFSKIERGITGISIERLTQIANILDVSLAEILFGPDDERLYREHREIKKLQDIIEEREKDLNALRVKAILLYEELTQS